MPDTHITIPMARLIELETAEQERDIFRSERLDMALLVGRLIRRMRAARTGEGMAAGDDALEQQCIGYLRRKGLTSPLREEGPTTRVTGPRRPKAVAGPVDPPVRLLVNEATTLGEQRMNFAALAAASRGDLANALVASTPGGIERQEAAGQRTLVESAMLPKEISGATREQLTALGFKFGADVDELFVACELPPGWTKRGTEHSMHSDLLDEQGRKRACIFYKAAFYDRRADMNMERRYRVDCYRDGSTDQMRRVDVTDCGAVIKEFGEVKRDDWDGIYALEKAAKAWLAEQHPEWQNPLACW